MKANEWNLCKDLLRFLHSVDESGDVLREAIRELGIGQQTSSSPIEEEEESSTPPPPRSPTPPPPPPPSRTDPIIPARKIVSPTPRRSRDLSPPSFPSPLPSPNPPPSHTMSTTRMMPPMFTRSPSSSSSVGSAVGLGSVLYGQGGRGAVGLGLEAEGKRLGEAGKRGASGSSGGGGADGSGRRWI